MTDIKEFRLIGLALPGKTTNLNGQSAIDCGKLWQKFETGGYADKIPGKLSDEIFAVYHNYDGDYTKPFSYFIGCKTDDTVMSENGLDSLIVPSGTYDLFIAKGKMPDCIAGTWKNIWASSTLRAYRFDFEVYGEKSRNWNDAEVEIYISVKK
jgi:predicted transcriptional regulator YdeE